jgi:hypothetical protein
MALPEDVMSTKPAAQTVRTHTTEDGVPHAVMSLGDIKDRLSIGCPGFSLSVESLARLGINPDWTDKRANLFKVERWAEIRAAISAHVLAC